MKLLHEIATLADGRDITRGYVEQLAYLAPQDRILKLQGGRNYELYQDILRDGRVKSALEQRRLAMLARPLVVTPGGERRRDRQAAEFLEQTLAHIRWDTISEKMHYGRYYGYAIGECLWSRDGRHIILDRFKVRDRRRFVFDADFRPLLLTTNQPQGEPLPPKKFWWFSAGADHDDEPYGLGLAHYLYWPVFFKRHQTSFWLKLLERFGRPQPIGKNRLQASAEEKKQLKEAVEQIMNGGAVTISESDAIEFLENRLSGSAEYGAFTDYINREIAQIIIGQTMTMDDGSSRSQAETHLKVRADLIKADTRLIHDSFNRSVVRWLTDWNYPGAAYPVTGRDMEDPLDLDALATRDAKIAKMMGQRPTAEYIEETYNLPLDEPVQAQPAPTDLPPPSSALAEPTDSDAKAALLDQTRSRAGPKFDGLIQAARSALDQAESLDDYRDWLTDQAIDALDSRPLGQVLGEALTVAFLSGWADSAESSPMFAEPSEAYLPFKEQIAFFRNKISMPTRTWTDIYEMQHDVAFVVAGAAKANLLNDLRRAVDAAITQGETLRQFRAQFDDVVAKRDWSYNGGRDWRTRVIYDTNLNTSYAAGRYQQMQAVKADRPWWRYRHSEAVTEPREEHLAWDGLVLHADDPWWTTHYPPNGWGCQCYVETLSDEDLARLGKDGPDKAPDKAIKQMLVGRAVPREVSVPRGIDPGFAYAPGRTTQLGHAVQHALRGTLKQTPDIASRNIAKTLADVPRAQKRLREDWQNWVEAAARSQPDKLDAFDVGVLPVEVIRALRQRPNPIEVSASLVTIAQAQLNHLRRDTKRMRDAALSIEDIERLPEIIAEPKAVLWDNEEQGLLFVMAATGKKQGKVFIRVEYARDTKLAKSDKQKMITNSIRSAGYVRPEDIKVRRYEILTGNL